MDSFFHMLNSHFASVRYKSHAISFSSVLARYTHTHTRASAKSFWLHFFFRCFALMSLIFASSSMSRCVADGIYLNMNKSNVHSVRTPTALTGSSEERSVARATECSQVDIDEISCLFRIYSFFYGSIMCYHFHSIDLMWFRLCAMRIFRAVPLLFCIWFVNFSLLRTCSINIVAVVVVQRQQNRTSFFTRDMSQALVYVNCVRLYYVERREHYLLFQLLPANNNISSSGSSSSQGSGGREEDGNQQEYIHDDMVK